MGFHIINIENGCLKHDFVDTFEELSYIDFITEDSVIYQGEEHWKPFKISESEKYCHFAKGWYRAGIRAQELFKDQALAFGLILEELNQDQKSFKLYTSNAKKLAIKRGDFLVRNYANIEIDVKCRGFRKNNGETCFDFKCEDADKHFNMQTFTKTPILIAVYENINNKPRDTDVYFFSINDLKNSQLETHYRSDVGKCYRVPLHFTTKGFGFIEETYLKHTGIKQKSYTLDEKRINHPNAYLKWTEQDDEKLEILFCEGKTIRELSEYFGRNNGAIRSRIEKLELKEKYDG
jgi:hypothetical protein